MNEGRVGKVKGGQGSTKRTGERGGDLEVSLHRSLPVHRTGKGRRKEGRKVQMSEGRGREK